MLIGIPRETRPGETRVAATPETVKKLAASGAHKIVVEGGAGQGLRIPDADYVAAGATVGRPPTRLARTSCSRCARRRPTSSPRLKSATPFWSAC